MKLVILTAALLISSFACAETEKIIKVNEVLEGFEKNATNAREKFLNKKLQLRGVCAKIKKNEENYVLELNSMDDAFLSTAIKCEFSAYERQSLKYVESGDELVVEGTMVSKHRMKNCTLIEVVPQGGSSIQSGHSSKSDNNDGHCAQCEHDRKCERDDDTLRKENKPTYLQIAKRSGARVACADDDRGVRIRRWPVSNPKVVGIVADISHSVQY